MAVGRLYMSVYNVCKLLNKGIKPVVIVLRNNHTKNFVNMHEFIYITNFLKPKVKICKFISL